MFYLITLLTVLPIRTSHNSHCVKKVVRTDKELNLNTPATIRIMPLLNIYLSIIHIKIKNMKLQLTIHYLQYTVLYNM